MSIGDGVCREAQYKQALETTEYLGAIYRVLQTMPMQSLEDLRSELILHAEEHWDQWTHWDRSLAVAEMLKVHVVLSRAVYESRIQQGEDPEERWLLITPESKLEAALLRQREYRLPNPLILSVNQDREHRRLGYDTDDLVTEVEYVGE